LRRIPRSIAHFASRFTPYYYRLTRKKPRFTSYSLETLQSNSVISHAKAQRELGYSPRPMKTTLLDTVRWFRENKRQLQGAH
jgi:dihydroflavonol-4-reductase